MKSILKYIFLNIKPCADGSMEIQAKRMTGGLMILSCFLCAAERLENHRYLRFGDIALFFAAF